MLAPAKINLDLLITGKRADGFHLLDSIVVFADFGDQITAQLSDHLELTISGPFAHQLGDGSDNLILKAANLTCEKAGILPHIKFHLQKNLPVSSGIGGGSADAAVAMKLCIEKFDLKFEQKELVRLGLMLGADVPVCLHNKAVQMCGVGDKLTNINIVGALFLVLVNPGVSVSTPIIFKEYAKYNNRFDGIRDISTDKIIFSCLIELLNKSHNCLQKPALDIEPVIKHVLSEINETENLKLSRMSGSGATCFGLYVNGEDAINSAKIIAAKHSDWWVRSVRVN